MRNFSRAHFSKLKNLFLKQAKECLVGVAELSDPKVGDAILRLQHPQLLIRADGRSPVQIRETHGLRSRVGEENIKHIRHSQVEEYQQSNQNPFGWGACKNIQDLSYFLRMNSSHCHDAWIHKFYGHSTSLLSLKLETGITPTGHDSENEEIIVGKIPFQQFIVSVSPQFREKFLDGGLVPNAMHTYNSHLPRTVRLEDLCTQQDVLAWLLREEAEDKFHDICQFLYQNCNRETLEKELRGADDMLIDTVWSSISSPQSTFSSNL